jgi:hypothetical protein
MSGCVSGYMYGERERSFPIVPRGSSERERSFPSVTGPEEAMWSEDNPGVCPGKTFVMRPSRCGGSVGGCVWLVLCVMLMSPWDDGDVDTCGLLCDDASPTPNAGLVLMGRKFSGVSGGAWGTWNWANKKLCATASQRVAHGYLMRLHNNYQRWEW